MFYGEHQQSRVKTYCVTMAYHPDGTPKRSYGVYYSDLGGVYVSDGKIEVDGKIVEYEQ